MTAPLDPSQDPDRYDPDRLPELPKGLDPRFDPDRFDGTQNLTELIGKDGAFEERDNYQWAYGLLAVLLFLAAVAFLFNNVLSPR